MNREERKELTSFKEMVKRLAHKGAIVSVQWAPGDVAENDDLEPEDGAYCE